MKKVIICILCFIALAIASIYVGKLAADQIDRGWEVQERIYEIERVRLQGGEF